jgi:hypothetical protein
MVLANEVGCAGESRFSISQNRVSQWYADNVFIADD